MSIDSSDDYPLPENELGEAAATPHEKGEGEDSAALLAELDTLLERMMALPVNHLDEPPPEELRQPNEPPENVALITVTEAVPDHQIPPGLPPVSTLDDDLYVQELLRQREAAPPPPPAEPVIFRNEPPIPEPLPTLTAALPEDPRPPSPPPQDRNAEPHPVWVKPLVLCNRGYDALTGRLGRAGQGLRHPLGRKLLGWAGVGMLLLVVGLALSDCLGWTR